MYYILKMLARAVIPLALATSTTGSPKGSTRRSNSG
jgi:hypothetical protein